MRVFRGVLLSLLLVKEARCFTVAPRASRSTRISSLRPLSTSTRLGQASSFSATETYDHIIIGSGMGGLTTASLLAQSTNDRICIVEQHDRIGGCTHVFDRSGYTFATGIHYVGEMGQDSTGFGLKTMLDALTPQADPILWDRLPENYDTVLLGREKLRRFDMVARNQSATLKSAFPSESAAIDVYFDLIDKAAKAGKRGMLFKALPTSVVKWLINKGWDRKVDAGFSTYAGLSVEKVVTDLTSNPDLQKVLMYSWFDYGTPPDKAPFVMHAVLTKHYADGAYYPRSGPKAIGDKIAMVLKQRDCDIKLRAGVRRILVEEGTATGVELVDGRILRASKSIVSNAGYKNTFGRLLPKAYRQSLDRVGNSPTGLNLFVGLRGLHDIDYSLPRQQLWMYPDDIPMSEILDRFPRSLKGVDYLHCDDFAPVFIGCPSGKDSRWNFRHPGRSAIEILTAVPWGWFQEFAPEPSPDGQSDPGGRPGSHSELYESLKPILAQLVWDRARRGLIRAGASERLPLSLEDMDFYELATPLTFAHYLWAEEGAFYGLDHSVTRFDPYKFYLTLRPECEIKCLYLTGQDVASCGMAGAMFGGYLCAAKVLGNRSPFGLVGKVKRHRVVGEQASKGKGVSLKPVLVAMKKTAKPVVARAKSAASSALKTSKTAGASGWKSVKKVSRSALNGTRVVATSAWTGIKKASKTAFEQSKSATASAIKAIKKATPTREQTKATVGRLTGLFNKSSSKDGRQ